MWYTPSVCGTPLPPLPPARACSLRLGAVSQGEGLPAVPFPPFDSWGLCSPSLPISPSRKGRPCPAPCLAASRALGSHERATLRGQGPRGPWAVVGPYALGWGFSCSCVRHWCANWCAPTLHSGMGTYWVEAPGTGTGAQGRSVPGEVKGMLRSRGVPVAGEGTPGPGCGTAQHGKGSEEARETWLAEVVGT